LSKVFSKPVSMRTSANTPVRSRTLPFAHRTHRDVECKSCHTSGILLSVVRDCQSCHGEHHTAERTCATCHAPAKAMHERDAHDGCAGSTCHANATVLSLPPSRTTCLACHTEQVSHKPKRECSDCHAVRWTPAARPSR
jgi:DnaJ-class molecular chaperone